VPGGRRARSAHPGFWRGSFRVSTVAGAGGHSDSAVTRAAAARAARFVVAGRLDPANRGALSAREIHELVAASGVTWLGDCRDMARCMRDAHIVCLPTYYREGVPKVLLEACAAGRAIITTDTPGCRDVVRAGENGLLVPPQNARALAAAIRQLLEDPQQRARMGIVGRARAEREFGIEKVVQSHLELYRELIEPGAAET
jgi:glycosyltransferase involved in cell wall biosynthesis